MSRTNLHAHSVSGTTERTDDELWSRLRDSDERALAALLKRHQRAMTRIARYGLGRAGISRDERAGDVEEELADIFCVSAARETVGFTSNEEGCVHGQTGGRGK